MDEPRRGWPIARVMTIDRQSPKKIAVLWCFGFIVATLLIWPTGAVLLSSVIVWDFDEAIGDWLPKAGQTVHFTEEGWGTTRYGPYGIPGNAGMPEEADKVMFWGDSFVEAHQVPDRDKMFSPYFSTTKRGTGLGLAIVHKVVTEHQGTIRVEPNRPNGARFVIELPALEPRAAQKEA